MSSSGTPFTTVAFEDGTYAVVRTNPSKPHVLEVVAAFYDASRARSYAETENGWSGEQVIALPEAAHQPTEVMLELSQRQSAVLGALRAKMDANKQVEAKAAVLADAANIPLGSLHSVLHSLEKKQLIKTARTGSVRAPAIYQVL